MDFSLRADEIKLWLGPEQGSLRCFADGTNQSLVIVCTQARWISQQADYQVALCNHALDTEKTTGLTAP